MTNSIPSPPVLEPKTAQEIAHQEWVDRVQPQPHRCHEHLDDLMAAFQTWPLEVQGPWKSFWACQRSNAT
jgi:hypothetical protein